MLTKTVTKRAQPELEEGRARRNWRFPIRLALPNVARPGDEIIDVVGDEIKPGRAYKYANVHYKRFDWFAGDVRRPATRA